MKSALMKALSILLVVATIVTSFPMNVFAENIQDSQNQSLETEDTIEVGSVDDVLSESFNDATALQSDDYAITGLENYGYGYNVSFTTTQACTIMVAVYVENTNEMITAASVNVSANETEAFVEFEEVLPASYSVKAFMLDSNYAPLCKPYYCNDTSYGCGENGHIAGDCVKENEVTATCATEGRYDSVVYCSVCGEELSRETISVPATGEHVYSKEIERVEPTCTEDGYIVKACGCSDDVNEKTTLPATGHTETKAVIKPTCTEIGYTEYYCSICGNVRTDDEVPANGHDYRSRVTEPTCTEAGYTRYVCPFCKDSYIANETEPTGHNYTADVTVPTCTEEGYTVYTCMVCGDTYVSDYTYPIGHDIYEYDENHVDPTCESDGSYDLVQYCYNCGEEISRETVVIPAIGHDIYEYDENHVDPTCESDGSYDLVQYCYNCGEELSRETVVIPAIGHDIYEYDDNHIAPTCESDGSYDLVQYCYNCDVELSRETVVIPAIGHYYDAFVTAPTCTAKGYTTYTCSACGDSYVADVTEMVNHTPAAPVGENATDATCGASGFYDEVVYCSLCNTELSREHKTVEALPHSPAAAVEENRVESTCTVAGSYDEVVYCSVCSEELSRETKVFELVAHTPGEAVVEDVVDATCTADGSYCNVVYCTVCNEELSHDTVTVEKLPHTPAVAVEENRVESTCTVAGSYDNVVYCTVCNEELSRDTVTVGMIAHAYDAVVTAPTCTDAGYTTYICTACGDSYVADEVAAYGHISKTISVPATCTVAGMEYTICEVCGETLGDASVIPAKGHNYLKFVTEAGCVEQGYTTYKCSTCGDQYKGNYVAATGHGPCYEEIENEVAATCTTAGSYDNVVYCDTCWEEVSRETVSIPALGHNYVNGVCSRCDSDEDSGLFDDSGSNDEFIWASLNTFSLQAVSDSGVCWVATAPDAIKDNEYFIIVLKDSASIADFSDSDILYVDQKTADKDGDIAFTYIPKSVASYAYIIGCFSDTNTVKQEKVTPVLYEEQSCSHSNTETISGYDASCETTGLTDGTKCLDCGEVIVPQEEIPVRGHTIVDGVCVECGYSDFPSGTCGDNLTWVFNPTTGTLTISGTGEMYDYEYDDGSNHPWKDYEDNIKNVVINDGVTTIGDYAFAYSGNLTNVTIPDSVTSVGEGAFGVCTSLTNVTIPDSVTSVGDFAFSWCDSLTSVTIPDSVTTIGQGAFYSCYNLTSITVDSNNQNYSSDEYGVLFNKEKTTLVQYPVGNTRTNYTIPDSVTTIGDRAFHSCEGLTSVTIPDSVTTIPEYAFVSCTGLVSIVIPYSVKTIENYAFDSCDSLTDIYFSFTEDVWDITVAVNGNDPFLNANKHFVDGEHEHNYSSDVVPPTCTEQGYTTYTCSCGDEYISDYTAPLGHNYTENMVDASCTTDGYTEYKCAYCGDFYRTDYITAWGHEYTSRVYNPTCTKEGYTLYTCVYCLDSYKTDFIPAYGHDFSDWTVAKEPTVLSEGKETRTCKTCNFTETRILDKIEVDVEINENYGLVNLTVVHAQTLKPINNANIFVSTEKDGENTFSTDANGKVSIILPVGEHVVSAYYSGCLTRNVSITVNSGVNDIPEIGLSDKPVYEASLTSKEMTLEEIKEAGIDTSNPNNQNLFKYELQLEFDAQVDMESIVYYMNPETKEIVTPDPKPDPDPEPAKPQLHYHIVSGNHSWCKYETVEIGETVSLSYKPTRSNKDYVFDGWYEDSSFTQKITSVEIKGNNTIVYGRWKYVGTGSEPIAITGGGNGGFRYETTTGPVTVYPVNEYFCLIVHGEITWLKEMFDVEMLVINNSKTDTLEDLTASLNLPDGLSLADMVSGQQTLTQSIPDISGEESKSVHWYVRGDKAGSYDLNAQLKGKVMPFNETIDDNYILENKINVYSGNAMHLHFEMPDAAFYAEDYPIRITLENVSDKTLYNVHHAIQIEQGMKVFYSDGTTKEKVEVSDWFSKGVEKFYPGDKLIFEASVNIFFESEVIQYKLEQLIGIVDNIEMLCNAIKIVGVVGDAISILSGGIGAVTTVLENVAESIIDANDSVDSVRELKIELNELNALCNSNGNSALEAANKFRNSSAYCDIQEITNNPEEWFANHNEAEVKALTAKIRTIKKDCFNVDSKPMRKFDIFDSIRTAISAIPVRFVLESVVMTVSEESNVQIPWSYSTYHAGPRYFGVSSVSKYCSSIYTAILAELYEESVPSYLRLIDGIDDPLNKQDAIAYIQATENEIARIKAKDATGEVTFRAWIESGNSNGFDITTDNDSAKYEDGMLEFTGDGTISVTPKDNEGGVIHIEDSEGNSYEYVIDVVEQHECKAGAMEVILAPTPETDGFAVKRCVTCKEVMDIIPLAYEDCCKVHTFTEWIVESEATDTDAGINSRYCTVCGATEYEYTDPLVHEHIYDNGVYTIAPDCINSGVITYTCTICGDSYVEEVPPTGHDYKAVVTAPTCTEDGYTTYTCDCGNLYVADEITATGHTEGEAVVENATSATCGQSGKYDNVVYCTVCSEELSRETVIVDKVPHAYDDGVVTIAPTCLTEGIMTYTCSVCGDSYVVEVPPTGHKYTSVVTAPTCTEDGYTTYTCDCGNLYITDETPATGHNFVDGKCSYCGKAIPENAPKVVVSQISPIALVGKQVKVAISLENNPGITSMLLNVNYDMDKLQLVSVEDSGNLGSAVHSNTLNSPYTLSWANDTATENIAYNGEVVVLTFNVLEDAELGETPIAVTYDYNNYDIIDKDMNPVEFIVVDGFVNIIDVIIGDVNEDGKINTLDRVILTRYIAKWEEYSEGSINTIAADVNCDGKVNTLDRVILTRYIAKWEGYETLPYVG